MTTEDEGGAERPTRQTSGQSRTRTPERIEAAADRLRQIWANIQAAEQAQERNRAERLENWRLACAFDNIDPTASFVVFSEENPYMKA